MSYRSRPKQLRFLLATAGITAVALVVTACGGSSGGALGSQGSSSDTKLVIATNESPWLNAYKATVAEYQKQTGVTVELRSFPADELRSQEVNDIQAGTNAYDIYQIDEPNSQEFMANQWIKPLTAVDPAFKPDPNTYSYDNVAWWNPETKTSDPKGELMVQPINGNIGLFIYRSDIYDSQGLTAPTTWEDVLANGKKAQASGAAKYGYIVRTQSSASAAAATTFDFLPFFYAYGAKWFADEGTDWTPTVNTPEAIAAATMYRELAKLGPAETTTIGQAQVIGGMQSGDALQTNLVAAGAAQLENANDSNITGKVTYSVLPEGPTGVHGVQQGVQTLGIPARLDETRSKAALDFIKWFESKEAQLLFAANGGLPTRNDIIGDPALDMTNRGYLQAVQDSAEYVQRSIRYPFNATMLPVTEKWLGQIAAGSVTPEEGMNNMQADLTKVVKDAGFPMTGA